MERKTPKVYNRFNSPQGKPVPQGSDIYEWQYLDKASGEIKTNKKNVKEEINSYLPTVDYKRAIQNGELEINANDTGGTRDYRSLPDTKVDFIKFINTVASMDKAQVSEYIQQITGGTSPTISNDKNNPEKQKQDPKAPKEIKQTKSTDGDSNQPDTNGGTKE